MSSSTSRAPIPGSGWQQQPNPNKSNRNLTPQRTSQSPRQEFKTQNSQSVASFPVHSIEASTANIYSTPFDEHDSHHNNLSAEGRDSGSSLDYYSQHTQHGSYLTPDRGSEIPYSSEQSSYNSPSLDDPFWLNNFNIEQGLDDFGSDGTLVSTFFPNVDPSSDLIGMIPKGTSTSSIEAQSTAPQMSAIATTTSTIVSEPRSLTPVQLPTQKMAEDKGKRLRSLDDDESMHDRVSRSISHQQSAQGSGSSMRDVVNPTVLVSTYNRGDSPARVGIPMARSLSKRSQSSRLSDHSETVAPQEVESSTTIPLTSRLMPPDQYGRTTWEDDEEEDEETDRGGVAPTQRNDAVIPSLNDMDKQRELDENRVGVENWLATSETGSPTGTEAERAFRSRVRRERMRSRSTGARTDPTFNDKNIPGPGVLLDVESEHEYTDDGSSYISDEDNAENPSKSPPANVEAFDPDEKREDSGYFPILDDAEVAPDEQEPLPRQFYRRAPWQDHARFAEPSDIPGQPPTSNHAIMQYDQQAAKFETASRAATWGTRRRLSDSEIASIVEGTKVRHLSLSSKVRDRGNSIVNRARTVIRRSSSNIKKSKDHLPRQSSPSNDTDKISVLDNEHTATSPIQQVQRTLSWGKSKSPPLTTTSGALMAMTGQMAAIGASTTPSVEPPERPLERPKSPFLSALKRSRSKSDLPKTPGLSDLFNRHGGPPVPTLASPMQLRSELHETNHTINNVPKAAENIDEDMDEDNDDEIGVKMELPVQHHNIIPNLDGFRTHARQLNPRLDQYLVERIAQDQLRRYKKLVKNKIDHTRNVQLKQHCPSGTFCVDLGGKPKILPPRTSTKDNNVNYAQFKIGAAGDSDGEEAAFVEGVVTPALFPQGIPLPPTTHLPAEFECPLCFQVKKFQKPSDWTKHVHEDVQPFSCTFPNCPEPKSFKRKADWVRHENERHRHLEWWKCSIPECAHICYRKDNFVQHLVREHKMTEPKAKGSRQAGNRTRPAARSVQALGAETDDFWQLVEKCRHDTSQTPRNEPCKFCGNVCSTWKKLSVHVGKHMEQIAMPILDLAAKRAITADTVISPIDPPNQRMAQASMLDTTTMNGNNFDALSPYTPNAVSAYQSSSAGQSPVPMHSVHSQGSHAGPSYYDQGMVQPGMQQIFNNQFGGNQAASHSYPYPSYEIVNGQIVAHQANAFTQPQPAQNVAAHYNTQQVPRSQPLDNGYGTLNVDTMHAALYSNDGYYPNSAPGGTYMGSFSNGLSHSNSLHGQQTRQTGPLHNPNHLMQQSSNEFPYTIHHNRAYGYTSDS